MRRLIISTLLTGAAFAAQPAQAALVSAGVPCAASDIGLVADANFACNGFWQGNLASDATTGDIEDALELLGLVFPDAFANKIEKVEGAPAISGTTLNFVTPLSGITYIGIHWGNYPNPGKGPPLATNITSFYKFDAGVSLDTLTVAFDSISNATLYKTSTPAIPEPATWAMMLAGFGVVGYAMRRRRNVAVSFA